MPAMRRAVLAVGCIVAVVLAWVAWQSPAGDTHAQEDPRLANLEIDIWPEFDQPSVLVILHGEIAGDVTLPATVSLRIPTSSGGPTAVASAATASARLVSLAYARTDIQVDLMTLRFTTPDRFFQVEFYDRLSTDNPERNYAYLWPGDLPVGELVVQVQQPAGATDLSVQPDLGASLAGPDGLAYSQASLGAFDAGKPLPISVRYNKTDPRTSAEILGLRTPAAPSATGTGSGLGISTWLLVLAAVTALVVAGGGAILWRWRPWPSSSAAGGRTRAQRRRQGAGGPEKAPGSCQQCGSRLRSGARFCSDCGAPLRRG